MDKFRSIQRKNLFLVKAFMAGIKVPCEQILAGGKRPWFYFSAAFFFSFLFYLNLLRVSSFAVHLPRLASCDVFRKNIGYYEHDKQCERARARRYMSCIAISTISNNYYVNVGSSWDTKVCFKLTL